MDRESARKRLCVALDVSSPQQAIELASLLKNHVGLFKIGSELYTSSGPDIVRKITELGGEVFLDLKYHDIPNTVAQAARVVTRIGVAMFNLHAAGGTEMIRAAVIAAQEEASKQGGKTPIILAVTVLTSITGFILTSEMLIPRPIEEAVQHFAQLAKSAGAQGVVSSPQEVPLIRNVCGNDFLTVTPGVRPAWSVSNDQKRITTPGEAIALGSDYIVVGRPILKASDPQEAAQSIVQEMMSAK